MRNKMKWRRPSPAMIMALIALFVAFGGTVYAGTKISGKTIRKNSEPGNRIKKDTVTGKQVKESTLGQVPSAAAANSATTATTATTARSLTLFAHVNANGTVDGANSLGISSANVNNATTGTYCFRGLPFAPKGFAAVGEDTPASATNVTFELQPNNVLFCPAGTQLDVEVSTDAGAYTNKAFYITIYG